MKDVGYYLVTILVEELYFQYSVSGRTRPVQVFMRISFVYENTSYILLVAKYYYIIHQVNLCNYLEIKIIQL